MMAGDDSHMAALPTAGAGLEQALMTRDAVPSISVNGLCKAFGTGQARTVALEQVSLTVHPGELVLLMGPSGSGKTTLLSIMGCILRPDSGQVAIHGEVVTGLSEPELCRVRLSKLGFVFQNYNLFPTLRAVENVMVALDLKGVSMSQARERAAEVMDTVGLGDKLMSLPEDLSGGQKQRLAIARALAGDPEIILADEPTAALDSVNGRLVIGLLRDLARQRGRCVVVVTHDNRIFEFADRIVRIEDGRINISEMNS
jgi:putative ABC transport system ATP-binding protein